MTGFSSVILGNCFDAVVAKFVDKRFSVRKISHQLGFEPRGLKREKEI